MTLIFPSSSLYTILFFLLICKGISGATFTLINRCDYTIWPGILANSGSATLDSTGFELSPGGSRSFQAPPGWSGRLWGRTGCTLDLNTRQFSCSTGDCGSNQVECNGSGATPPATLAEFTIGSGVQSSPQDFYDVSLVDGYNLPMIVEPNGGTGLCGSTGCITDLNRVCPVELRAGDGQACKSACEAFRTPEYCCSGAYGIPDVCKPSIYSEMFKSACPRSYSYAYDDATSTFTCTGADYTITFCTSSTSQKSSRDTSIPVTIGPPIPVTTATTNATPMTPEPTNVFGSGSQENSTSVNGSWLPNFATRNSSWTTISNVYVHITLIASLLALLIF